LLLHLDWKWRVRNIKDQCCFAKFLITAASELAADTPALVRCQKVRMWCQRFIGSNYTAARPTAAKQRTIVKQNVEAKRGIPKLLQWHTRSQGGPFPPSSSISCDFVLWGTVSRTKYCCSLKINIFDLPQILGWLRYCAVTSAFRQQGQIRTFHTKVTYCSAPFVDHRRQVLSLALAQHSWRAFRGL